LGKSRWAFKTALDTGAIYMRLVANITVKEFLKKLLMKLEYKHLAPEAIYGTKHDIYTQIVSILQRNPGIVIFIDEVDYGFKNKDILASIRDFADESYATFVLVGMHDAKVQLLKMNTHYFDRCNGFCDFKELSKEDTANIMRGVCEVSVDDGISDFIYKKSNGTIRLINKYIEIIEEIGRKMKKSELIYKDISGVLSGLEV
jgi:hypothetical protein